MTPLRARCRLTNGAEPGGLRGPLAMPINVRCEACGGRFQAPDKLAGRRVKCPHCSGVIVVADRASKSAAGGTRAAGASVRTPPAQSPGSPGSAEAPWYVLTTDEEQLGPIGKAQVEALVAQGRLDAFCRLRQEGWSEWRWLEDVFPGMASPEASEASDVPSDAAACGVPSLAESEARLQPCPDCGQMVSRRATQCPHCGCPVAEVPPGDRAAGRPPLGVGVTLSGAAAGSTAGRQPKRRNKILLLAAGSAALVLASAVVGGWWLWNSWQKAAESLLDELTIEEPVSKPAPPPSPPAASQDYEAWAEEASAAMARDVDEVYRQMHLASSLLGQAEKKVDILKSLTDPKWGQEPSEEPPAPAPDAPDAYESQYDPLHAECLKYVRAKVPPGDASREAVWEAARQWAEAKRAPVEKQLQELVPKQLGL